MSPAQRSFLPYIALGVGVLALSFSGIFIHWAAVPGVVISFYRMAIATLVLFPVVVWRLRTVGLLPARLLIFPLIGGIFTALDHGTWSTAVSYTRIANATLLNNIAPIWVALFAAFIWRERLVSRFWLGLLLTMAGAGIVLGNDMIHQPHFTLGDGIAFFSSFFWAGYYLVTQRGRLFLDALIYIWLVDVVSAFSLGTVCLGIGVPLSGFSAQTWLVFIGAALVSQIGGHFLLAYALGHLPASVVSPTMISQPVLTSLLAIPLAGQALAAGQWLGGLTVLAGIYLVNISRTRQPVSTPELAVPALPET